MNCESVSIGSPICDSRNLGKGLFRYSLWTLLAKKHKTPFISKNGVINWETHCTDNPLTSLPAHSLFGIYLVLREIASEGQSSNSMWDHAKLEKQFQYSLTEVAKIQISKLHLLPPHYIKQNFKMWLFASSNEEPWSFPTFLATHYKSLNSVARNLRVINHQ